ncbi:aspartate carbamoyltransferase catalytic subunit [Novosphingobium lentum]|uniref:aspartate carbamoyltransferase catalytic subunit n=1 Tax=Novosphingobium lentum TaxID=145287 RepID=UPI000837A6B0|nr:aspartate carbamoyltransferase catalytic subunit [Novosphingobium lentum]
MQNETPAAAGTIRTGPAASGRYPAGGLAFPHRDLTGIGQLARHEILYLLDEAEQWVAHNRQPHGAQPLTQPHRRADLLRGLTIINAFFENSTRTLLSFEIAGKRLGADVVNMHAAQSSVKKGETLIDTAMTLNAMRADAIVIRHASSGAVRLIADKVDCPVLNAGDGQHEHPTQGLLDALTIRHAAAEQWGWSSAGGDLNGLKVTICGDLLHSRVARSNILCLTALGADVTVCAPPALMPEGIEAMGVAPTYDFDAALKGAQVVMMLRLQQERMQGQFIPSPREYRHLYGLTVDRLARCEPQALVMHPGPMNRGVEIDSQVADHATRSLITRQVEMGVAVRMACLDVLTRRSRNVAGWGDVP